MGKITSTQMALGKIFGFISILLFLLVLFISATNLFTHKNGIIEILSTVSICMVCIFCLAGNFYTNRKLDKVFLKTLIGNDGSYDLLPAVASFLPFHPSVIMMNGFFRWRVYISAISRFSLNHEKAKSTLKNIEKKINMGDILINRLFFISFFLWVIFSISSHFFK